MVDREAHAPVVEIVQLFLQHLHVVGQPGNPQQARLRVQQRLHFVRRHPFLGGDEVEDGRVDIARARPHHQAFERRHPHRRVDRVAPRMAVDEQPLPRCSVITFVCSRVSPCSMR